MYQITIDVALSFPLTKDDLESLTESLGVFFATRCMGFQSITSRTLNGQFNNAPPTLSQNPL